MTALRRGQGREALLDAAVRIVSREGYAGLTHRSVAAEAGVSHALVAYHFSTMPELVAEALQREVDASIERANLTPTSGAASDFAADLPDLLADDPDSAAFQYEVVLAARQHPELRPGVQSLYRAYLAAVTAGLVIDEDAEGDALATLAFAALDGLVLHYLTFGDRKALEQALDQLRKLLSRSGSRTGRTLRAVGDKRSR
jgi:AcrR family transcriptional regulator